MSSSHEIVHNYANGGFDWLISEHQRVNISREGISILSGKYERFTFVHPVLVLISFILLRPVHTIRIDSWFRKLEAGAQTVSFQGSVFVVRMSEGRL